jgi:hypothetical protein
MKNYCAVNNMQTRPGFHQANVALSSVSYTENTSYLPVHHAQRPRIEHGDPYLQARPGNRHGTCLQPWPCLQVGRRGTWALYPALSSLIHLPSHYEMDVVEHKKSEMSVAGR